MRETLKKRGREKVEERVEGVEDKRRLWGEAG